MTDSQQRLPPGEDAESAGRRVKEINHAARLKSRMLYDTSFISCTEDVFNQNGYAIFLIL